MVHKNDIPTHTGRWLLSGLIAPKRASSSSSSYLSSSSSSPSVVTILILVFAILITITIIIAITAAAWQPVGSLHWASGCLLWFIEPSLNLTNLMQRWKVEHSTVAFLQSNVKRVRQSFLQRLVWLGIQLEIDSEFSQKFLTTCLLSDHISACLETVRR